MILYFRRWWFSHCWRQRRCPPLASLHGLSANTGSPELRGVPDSRGLCAHSSTLSDTQVRSQKYTNRIYFSGFNNINASAKDNIRTLHLSWLSLLHIMRTKTSRVWDLQRTWWSKASFQCSHFFTLCHIFKKIKKNRLARILQFAGHKYSITKRITFGLFM